MRIDPLWLSDQQRADFLDWVRAEDLEAGEIANNGTFSVFAGRVSGNKFLFDADGKPLVRNGEPVLVHFKQPQKHPLPESLSPTRKKE